MGEEGGDRGGMLNEVVSSSKFSFFLRNYVVNIKHCYLFIQYCFSLSRYLEFADHQSASFRLVDCFVSLLSILIDTIKRGDLDPLLEGCVLPNNLPKLNQHGHGLSHRKILSVAGLILHQIEVKND